MNQQSPWDSTIREFVERAGSAKPTPGGGSTSALAAALGSAMTSMAASLSHRDRTPEQREEIDKAERGMKEIAERCEELLNEDMRSFAAYLEASEAAGGEKENEALAEASLRTIEVPLSLMEVCIRGLESARGIAGATRPHVLSDLGIGVVMFEAAARSAYLTVRINLPACRDGARREACADRADVLLHQAERLRDLALNEVTRAIEDEAERGRQA
ncbi:cyclodeaminase/cyclohydrolase family protein [Saccharibacillus sp. CPCC 101409]|uniref:cyclodeaminase/cyclohydrolase family protein n=1 Tax=Saccharibacillus sp. CPCC 101409 TaxID=3058041 RepID=UPI002672762E|nr:cyclodeaminase/cyclohydrolase family protein [Saccharibacillus sp. CPCC 101409]MDO3408723.1 cyclodeaminase/cyclohydrolase family protein [Saccharibacillus sp. CPCC 101409]